MAHDVRILRLEGGWCGDMENGDRNFLLSLLPGMSKMTYSEKLHFRSKITALMCEIDRNQSRTSRVLETSAIHHIDPQSSMSPSTPQLYGQYSQPQYPQTHHVRS